MTIQAFLKNWLRLDVPGDREAELELLTLVYRKGEIACVECNYPVAAGKVCPRHE